MRHSLRARLIAFLVPPIVVVLVSSALLQYHFTLRPAMAAFDQGLIDIAMALAQQLRNQREWNAFTLSPESEKLLRSDQQDATYYLVQGPDGRRLAGDAPLTSQSAAAQRGEIQLLDSEYENQNIRVAQLSAECGSNTCLIRVAETLNKRKNMTRDVLLSTLVPESILGALVIVFIWFGIGGALRPLTRLAQEIRSRTIADLTPVNVSKAPTEARDVVDALNALFARIALSNEHQKRFLADAAHQLRTPLAGLRSESELALLEAHPPEMHDKLRHINNSAARAARLASQLLALARSESDVQSADFAAAVDLKSLAQDILDEWVRDATRKNIDIGFELTPASLKAHRVLLGELMRNLVHNAIEYTPDAGHVTVRCGISNDRAYFEVEDSGPGIALSQRQKVFQRFYRVPGTIGAGSGLGLAIVKEIANAHHADIEMGEPAHGTGFRMRVNFPAEPQ